MSKDPFRFKQFSVSHASCAMPLSMESVVLGCWSMLGDANRILDVGTGCGILALICAQRGEATEILGIDCDEASVYEARFNFSHSPWAHRLMSALIPWEEFTDTGYDIIISNPPYFNSGIANPDTARLKARHTGALSPETLLSASPRILKPGGKLIMILPTESFISLLDSSPSEIRLTDYLYVQGKEGGTIKRVMAEFSYISNEDEACSEECNDTINILPDNRILTLYNSSGEPTKEFKALCGDFYLKF